MTLSSQGPCRGNSRQVTTNQPGPHPGLEERVRRHLAAPWRAPLQRASEQAFEAVDALRAAFGPGLPLVLDAGCGTGQSSRSLARRHDGALVIGVDRSAARLARVGADREPVREGRVIWARAELTTFWRCALGAGWRLDAHYLLYPNPWPKAAHLGRRWHGHPVLPTLLALGGRLELRSNWRLYLEEFAMALDLALDPMPSRPSAPERYRAEKGQGPLTPFESKYLASGHALWRWAITLP